MALAPHVDPKAGVFETMLVAGGHPVELDAHLARLAASLETLFGEEIPSGTGESVRERADGIELGRLRLTVAPGSDGKLMAEAVAAEVDPALIFPARERAVGLRSLVVEGGLGAHKWADRALLEREEVKEPGAVPLLLDRDETVLEASRGHVFVARDGGLATPPTDDRILPGIARGRAIEVAGEEGIDVREVELRLDDLLQADEVFLTGSVRGVEPVRSMDEAELSPAGELSERIAARLRRRWLG
jgi:branched-subunit amino acid aminotransferase/4-amino-4-deoxychorismate lyase